MDGGLRPSTEGFRAILEGHASVADQLFVVVHQLLGPALLEPSADVIPPTSTEVSWGSDPWG